MSARPFSSLRTRFFVFAMMVVVPAAALILWSDRRQWRSETDAAEKSALALARLTAADHAGLIEGVRQLLLGLCLSPQVRDQDLPACNALFARLLKDNKQYANIGMMDAAGDVVARGLPTTQKINVHGQPAARLLDASAGFMVIGCQVGRVSGVSGLVCGQPLVDSAGHLRGAIAISLRTEWVNRFVEPEALPPGATLTTINANGKLWTRYPDPDAWVDKVVPEASILVGVTEAGIKEAAGPDGKPNLYAFAPLDVPSAHGKVFTILSLPREPAMAAATRRLELNLIELGLVSVAAIWAVTMAGHFLVFRRLSALTAATQRLSAGDLTARAGLRTGPKEIVDLSQRFDDMASTLEWKTAQQVASDAALRRSEEHHRRLVETAEEGIWVIDARGRTTLANTKMASLVGRTPEFMIGRPLLDFVAPEDRAAAQQALERRGGDEQRGQHEFRFLRRDGTEFWAQVKTSPILQNEIFAGALAMVSDITARKWADRALKESERFLRDVLDSLLVFVAVLTPEGAVVQVNRAGLESLKAAGYEWDDVKGKGLDQTPWWSSSSEAQAQLCAAIARAARGQSSRFDAAYLGDGTRSRVVDFMLAPMFDAQGKVTHLIPSAIDITERKRAEERTQEQQAELAHLQRVRTMSQMAAGLAHELTQPLGAIVNYAGASAERIRSGDAEPAPLVDALVEIQKEALRAGEIIRRLRGFVKKQRPDGRPIDANLLVRESMGMLVFDLRHDGITPRIELADSLPLVLADMVQIQQVLVNLVRNALDAMASVDGASRRLAIRTSRAGPEHVRIEVTDTGCGVPPEQMERIFDAFFTTKSHGLGMGLALCRTIIEDHGGQLAGHLNESGGMTFSFTLRAAP